jgi:putative MATE family efflux protein
MVRGFGTEATAAIAVSRQVIFVVEACVMAVVTGVITLISHAAGAGDRPRLDRIIVQSLYLSLAWGLGTSGLGWLLAGQVLKWMNVGPGALGPAEGYLNVYFAGLVFSWTFYVATAVFRGCGDTMTPLKLAAVISVLNIAFNYVFIFGAGPIPEFKVPGAAMGTIAARTLAVIAYLVLLWRGRHLRRLSPQSVADRSRSGPLWKPDGGMIREILRIGLPIAGANVVRNGSRLVYLAIVGTMALGTSLQAAVGIGLQLRLISVLPALAFQTAAATLVGQSLGRRDVGAAERVARRCFWMLALTMLALTMLVVVASVFVFSSLLARWFVQSSETVPLAATVLRWFAVAQFFSALSIGTQGVLMGAGDTARVLWYMVVSQWIVLIPLAWAFSATTWGVEGILLAWIVAPIVSLSLLQRRVRSGKWKSLNKVSDVP